MGIGDARKAVGVDIDVPAAAAAGAAVICAYTGRAFPGAAAGDGGAFVIATGFLGSVVTLGDITFVNAEIILSHNRRRGLGITADMRFIHRLTRFLSHDAGRVSTCVPRYDPGLADRIRSTKRSKR